MNNEYNLQLENAWIQRRKSHHWLTAALLKRIYLHKWCTVNTFTRTEFRYKHKTLDKNKHTEDSDFNKTNQQKYEKMNIDGRRKQNVVAKIK